LLRADACFPSVQTVTKFDKLIEKRNLAVKVKVAFLKEHPHFLPLVARWCAAEWPSYYDQGSYQAAFEYHLTTLQTDSVPCGFVASEGGKLMGTISLLEEDMSIRPQYTPWLGCLYVDPAYRDRHGTVAKELTAFAEQHAFKLNIGDLYAWSHTLANHMKHIGWEEIERVNFLGGEAVILRKIIRPK